MNMLFLAVYSFVDPGDH